MPKNKIFSLITSILVFAALSQTTVLATESDSSAFLTATFEAESPEAVEIAELKKALADLQTELSTMKNGMQDLQAQILESEMEKLRDQLATIRGSTTTTLPTLPAQSIESYVTDSTEENSEVVAENLTTDTPEVTKIEDFVGFELEQGEETASVEEKEDEAEKTTIDLALETADAEIAKLEAILAEQEAAADKEASHTAVEQKVEELKATREKLEAAAIQQKDEKLQDENEQEVKVEKPSNIIAKADGEVLFQFPRAISQKTSPQRSSLAAKHLTADVIDLMSNEEGEFKRSAAPQKGWGLFSGSSLIVFGTILAIAIAVFVFWLVRNERQLLAATSRRFQELDFKPNFGFKPQAKKSERTKNTSKHKNTVK